MINTDTLNIAPELLGLTNVRKHGIDLHEATAEIPLWFETSPFSEISP
jgi:hypothetical protein